MIDTIMLYVLLIDLFHLTLNFLLWSSTGTNSWK